MIDLYTSFVITIMLGWVAFQILKIALPYKQSLITGLLVGLAFATIGRTSLPVTFLVATFFPVAFTIPAIVIRDFMNKAGISCPPIKRWEIGLFLIIYSAFLAASMGAIAFDPYRFGYDPVWAGLVAMLLVAYTAWRKNPFPAIIAVTGQALWLAGIGSSNYFDQIGHFLLLPILLFALFKPAPRG